jgi:hypothetical protein
VDDEVNVDDEIDVDDGDTTMPRLDGKEREESFAYVTESVTRMRSTLMTRLTWITRSTLRMRSMTTMSQREQ